MPVLGTNLRQPNSTGFIRYRRENYILNNSSVLASFLPLKNLSSTLSKTELLPGTSENKVMQDCNFISSGLPNICFALSMERFKSVSEIWISRGPKMACCRYILASVKLPIAKYLEFSLYPKPANCGKIYHIQCVLFRPAWSSESAFE